MNTKANYLSSCLLIVLVLLFSCQEEQSDNILNQLKDNGKINIFSLTIVTTAPVNDTALQNIRVLSAFTNTGCKALADAGILRLGSNIYYPYNTIADMKIDKSILNDEEAITRSVQEQVAGYFANTKPKDYDSLITSNPPYFNERDLLLNHLSKTVADSIFFFSPSAAGGAVVQVGSRVYQVYNDPAALRAAISNLVCKGQGTISVFYNPPASLQSIDEALAATPVPPPAKGTPAGDTCIGTSRFQRVHDGFGAYMAGRLIEANSPSCGGIVPPQPGVEAPKERPTPPKETRTIPAKPTPATAKPAEPTRRPEVAKAPPPVDNRCARKSDPECEKDEAGNYTGRRVQYCYNSAGKTIRTIVLSKCDADCRCL